jgi:hypothetical protein
VTRWRSLAAAVLLAATAGVAGLATAPQRAGADPLYLEWPALLPGLTDGFDPGSSNVCVAGKVECIDAAVREMQRRYAPLAASCSHQALFALTYLRVTETYAWSARQPGYYPDPAWTNHSVAVFAKYYLRAFDAWTADPTSTAVPAAWRMAFTAADTGSVAGGGNFFLGLNAHINRDLAYAMAAAGLTTGGHSAKPNFDRVDALLNSVTAPLVAELSARLDPSMDDTALPLAVDAVATGNLMFTWREQAWRNAELMSTALTPLLRSTIATTVETNSVAQATAYRTAFALTGAFSRADRDAFCAAHHADPAPQPYPFGTPTG